MSKDSKPLVSIVVPAHDAEPFLGRCLDSLLAQTYENTQIIVVENGSTDATLQLALSYQDKGVEVCASSKVGVCAARNKGIDWANGQYLGFVDADDCVEPTYISEAVSLIMDNGLDLVVGGTKKIYGDEISLLQLSPSKGFVLLEDDATNVYVSQVLTNNACGDTGLGSCHASANWCHLFTKDAIGDVRFDEDLRYGEDALFNVEVALNAVRIGVSSSVWYRYIMQKESAVFRLTRRDDSEIRVMADKLLGIEGLTPECKRYAFCKCVSALHAVIRRSVNSGLTLRESIAFIKGVMRDNYWKNLFKEFDRCVSGLPRSRRFLVWSLRNNMTALLAIALRLKK